MNEMQLCQEINQELLTGLAWNPHRPVVAIFGSARLSPLTQAYQDAQNIAHTLSKEGWTILTGGGPGIMEAGNKGAFEAGGESVGLNIMLPHEQKGNDYQTTEFMFHHFTSRKAVFVRRTDVFIACEGGFGTLDEIFDTITQVQTGKRPKTQIVLMGREFWSPMMQWIETSFVSRGLISPKDVDLFHVVDSVKEACEAVKTIWENQNKNEPSYKEADQVREEKSSVISR